MDLGQVQLGSDVSLKISLSGGNLVLVVSLSAKAEVDALMGKLKAALPVELQPLAMAAQAAIDVSLA